MIEKFEHKGLWFLPSNVETKVHGILKYDYQNNISILELIGSFYEYVQHDKEEIILGITTDGEEITLVECYFKSSTGIPKDESYKLPNWKHDRLCTLNFTVKTILKGQHIGMLENVKFQQIYVKIFNLDEWVRISGLSKNNYEGVKTITYKSPEPIKVNLDEEFDLEIKFIANSPTQLRFTNELTLRQGTILSFNSKNYTCLDDFVSLIRKFNNFLSTSLQNPVRIESIELYSDKFVRTFHNDFQDLQPIHAYTIINQNLKFEKIKHEWEMLFTYNDIKDNFEGIMRKWFSNYEKFEAPFNLVLSQYYVSQYYLESLFINVAQAAESFHRRLDLIDDYPKTQQDEEYNNKVRRIIENAPDDLKKWVSSRISNPPKHFYDTRLKYLLKEFSNSELNKMIVDHNKFVKDISISRNYYTHFNKDLEVQALSGSELIYLYLRLRLLLICGFLIESGFEKSMLEKLIKEKSYNMFRDLIDG